MSDESTTNQDLGEFLATLARKVEELDEISREHLVAEQAQPKSVRKRRQANLLRSLETTG